MRWIIGIAVLALAMAVLLLTGGCGALKRWAYEPGDRDEWQHPEEVMAALGIAPGSRAADIGAGGGYFTFRLADAVGPTGRVYAVDIDRDMLGYLDKRAREEGFDQITVVEATPDDARLERESVDLILVSNTYHHLDDRVAYFGRLREDLLPGGRLAIIEFSGQGFLGWHSTDPATITSELAQAGYTLVHDHDFLPRQGFLVFEVARP